MKWPLSICHLKHGGQFHYKLPQSLDFLRVACSPPCHSGACRTPDGTTAPAISLRNRQRIKEAKAQRFGSVLVASQHITTHPDQSRCATLCLILQDYMNIYIYMYIYICIYIYIYKYVII